jgi:hypothetical protein
VKGWGDSGVTEGKQPNEDGTPTGDTHIHVHIRLPRKPKIDKEKWSNRLFAVLKLGGWLCVLCFAIVMGYGGWKQQQEEKQTLLKLEARDNLQAELFAAIECGTRETGVGEKEQIDCLRELSGNMPTVDALYESNKAHYAHFLENCGEAREGACEDLYRQHYGNMWFDEPKPWHYR